MGIYIKGMKMPDGCSRCFNDECLLPYSEYVPKSNRHPNCPIVEVKEPHGRLIDESQIETVYGEPMTTRYQWYTSITEKITHTDAPTIIEAEVE